MPGSMPDFFEPQPEDQTIILNRVTDSDASVTDYILENAAKCPNCCRETLEKTLVEPA